MAIDKVKRAFIWIRNALRIIDKTTLPGEILGEIRPTLDTFGWERLPEAQTTTFTGSAAADNVITSVVPQDVVRVILAASMQSTDATQALTEWIEIRSVLGGSLDIGISRPVLVGIGDNGTRVPLERIIYMNPGDRLVGRSSPAPAVATALQIRWLFIDLPVGEYIPAL